MRTSPSDFTSGDEQHVQALVARAIGSHAQTQKRQYRLPLDHAVRCNNRNVKLGSSCWKQPQFRSQQQQTHTRDQALVTVAHASKRRLEHKSINLSYLLLLPIVVVLPRTRRRGMPSKPTSKRSDDRPKSKAI